MQRGSNHEKIRLGGNKLSILKKIRAYFVSIFFLLIITQVYASADTTFQYVTQWGSEGSGTGKFDLPGGVAVDSSGNVYVADTLNDRIQVFSSNGTFIAQFGSYGYANGQFDSPTSVAVDSSGNIYVADYGNDRIQEFSSSYNFLTQWGVAGTGNGEFENPEGVAVDSSGNVYVADTGNNRIQKFVSSTGKYITQWGGGNCTSSTCPGGSGNGLLNGPQGVAVDSSGNVYVADTGNGLIQTFNSSYNFVTQWGSENSGFLPWSVAVDSSDNVYAVDYFNSLIQENSSNGSLLAEFGSHGSGNGQFSNPEGVAVDSSGNVYVADTYNSRIQKFSPAGTSTTFSITASAGTGGSISPSGTTVVSIGGSQVYTITASAGYSIANVLVDGSSVGAVGTYTFSDVIANHTISASFSATATYSILGAVSTSTGMAISGVTITLSGTSTGTTTTGSSGSYSFTGLSSGTYTITPSLSGYTFSPSNIVLSVSSENVTGENFTGTQSITCTNNPIMLAGTTNTFSTLTAAFTGILNGTIIEMEGVSVTDSPIFNQQNVSITLRGGYDCSFTVQSSYSTLVGTLTVRNGTVTVSNLKIQ